MQAVTQRRGARPGIQKRKEFAKTGAELYAKAELPASARDLACW